MKFEICKKFADITKSVQKVSFFLKICLFPSENFKLCKHKTGVLIFQFMLKLSVFFLKCEVGLT